MDYQSIANANNLKNRWVTF